MTPRTFAIGDIHGNINALNQCLKRCKFNYDIDTLIVLGDVFDGFPSSSCCVDKLMEIKNLIWIKGNHDEWVRMWFEGEWENESPLNKFNWLEQGGYATVESYLMRKDNPFEKHKEFIKCMKLYHIDEQNRLFIHAGIDWKFPIDAQPDPNVYYWDRLTWQNHADRHKRVGTKFPYTEVFIGHTDTSQKFIETKPIKRANLWNLDQGAGGIGRLTIMNIDNHKYWQSDMNGIGQGQYND